MTKSKKEVFNVRTQPIKDDCLDRISNIPYGKGFTVSIETEKEKRNNDQNALYWAWLTYLVGSGIGGYTKDGWHNFFKAKFLRNLLIAQNKDWITHYQNCDLVYQNSNYKAAVKTLVLNTVSTTDLSVKSMSQYLKSIDEFALDKSVTFPINNEYEYLNIRKQ